MNVEYSIFQTVPYYLSTHTAAAALRCWARVDSCPLDTVTPISKGVALRRLGPELHANIRRTSCKCSAFRHSQREEGWDSRVRGIRVFDYEDTVSRGLVDGTQCFVPEANAHHDAIPDYGRLVR